MDCVEMLVTPSLQDTKDNKPDMIRQIVEKLGRNAAMVGDRRFDMEGARANGVDGLGRDAGFWRRGRTGTERRKRPLSCAVRTN